MPLLKDYVSNLFRSMPDSSGHLAIHITENRCTLAVCSSTGVLVFLRSLDKPEPKLVPHFIQDVLNKHQTLFQKGFDSVTIGISTTNFTLIPTSLDVDAKEVMDTLTGSPTRVCITEEVNALQSTIIYSIPKNLEEILNQNFSNYKLLPSLKFGLENALNLQADAILIFEDNHFDCLTFRNNELQVVNRHQFVTPEDVVYFTGLSLKEANITPSEATIITTGTINPNDSIYNLLYKYIKNVEVRPFKTSISVRSDFKSPTQEYEYVLNLLHANY